MTLSRMRLTRSVRVTIPAMAALVGVAMAQGEETYKRPPDVVARALKAAPAPMVDLSPDRKWMLVGERRSMPPISELSRPMLRLAGLRISPDNNAQHNPWLSYTGLSVRPVAGGGAVAVEAPEGARITNVDWSPDGSMISFLATEADGSSLWVADAKTGRSRNVTGARASAILGDSVAWMPDSRRILARLVPDERGGEPQPTRVPTGPVAQETSGVTAPVRTFQDLLESPHDEALFEHYLTTQLALIDARSGSVKEIGEPGVYVTSAPAPDGEHLLVSRIVRPYSYLVTYWSFPEEVEVWNLRTNERKRIVSLPLRDQTPIQGVPTGPRDHEWRADAPATLVWAEALDGGDPSVKADERDKVMTFAAPFAGEPKEVARLEDRYSGLTWLDDDMGALVSEYDRDERWARTWRFDPDAPAFSPTLVWDRNVQDRYNDPGRPIMTLNEHAHSVALVTDGDIFLSGRGSTPAGDRPFLDRMDLATLETTRLWRNEGACYESVEDLLTEDGSVALTSYESPTEVANYFSVNVASGERAQLTQITDPAPELAGITKRLVTYPRADGVTLSATLYLPADYQEGQRLPLMVWAYPLEYNDARTGGQVTGSPYRFTRISGPSHLFLLTQGYAVMDNATMPVIGDPETVNDTFIAQIVDSAKAAIDFAASEGVADPQRAGVGGHSYGAFMTSNLLAHCDLFRAGIARSGAYNRTLTPFGFQSERRTLWEAPEVYFTISPFMHADTINEPILLIHGQMDNNSGTFPMQSERLYHAIKGHGGTARLVMLPYESHGYTAEESVMHVTAEMIEWMDAHVKHASESAETVGSAN